MWSRIPTSGTSAIPARTATSSSPPPARRPCWGDTGVCVNPADERYKGMVGKTVTLPIMNREIPIVADDYADLEFGTGAGEDDPGARPQRL